MQHKGESVERAIRQSGYSITNLAVKLGKSRRWMYHVFENPNVPVELILKIGKIIHYDFSGEIKELKNYSEKGNDTLISEPAKNYNEQKMETENWKNKYLELLEKYNELLTEISGKTKIQSKRKK